MANNPSKHETAQVVVGFPNAEERAHRLKVEVERLAHLSTTEWLYYVALDGYAEKYGTDEATLRRMVKAVIKENEKKARQEQAEERQCEQRAEKQLSAASRADERKQREQQRTQKEADREAEKKHREREKELAAIVKLPSVQHEPRLEAFAKRSGEDLVFLREEFSALVAFEEESSGIDNVEPWPDPVDLNALLNETMAQVRRFVVIHSEAGAVAVVLWIAFAWVHEIAVHSPILELHGAEPDCGKSTLCGVTKFTAPRGFTGANLTGPALYRFVDREKPTLVIDNADKLFARRPDLVEIVNVSWTRGTKIPRQEHGFTRWFDPFCSKAISGANTVLPKDTKTRTITVRLLPKLPDEEVEDFNHIDDDTFVTLRRKFARFTLDHAATIRDANPAMPGFNNRARMNWKLQTAIADLAGGAWPKAVREAAIKLTRERREPSEGKRLLTKLRELFAAHGPLLSNNQVQKLLHEDDEWADFRGRGPISKRQIAVLLDAYDIHPDYIHPHGKTERGYRVEQFATAFRHYLGEGKTLTRKRATVRKSRSKPEK